MDPQLGACVERYRSALAQGDTTTMDELLDERFLITYPTGAVADKPHYLAALAGSPARVLSVEQSEMQSIPHGEVSVVSFAMATRIDLRGTEHIMKTRTTQVWKLKQGSWRCISIHHCEFS